MSKRELLKRMKAVKTAERFALPNPHWVQSTRETLVQQVRNTLPAQPMPMPAKAKTAFSLITKQIAHSVRGPVFALSSAIAAILGGSLFGVSASERSLPGDILYPVKIASEQTRLAMTGSKTEKVKLKTTFVGRRVEEIKTLSKQDSQQKKVKEVTETLKRDLVTVKEQLKEVVQEATPMEIADAAKLVDQATTKVASDLKVLKLESTTMEEKQLLSEVQAAAINTSVNAVATLVEVQKNPEAQISTEEVNKVLTDRIETVKQDITITADKIQVLTTSTLEVIIAPTASATIPMVVTASSSAVQLNSASTTLKEATVLVGEQKLDEAAQKLVEAATTLVEADAAIDVVTSQTEGSVTQTTSTVDTPPPESSTTTKAN